MAWPSFFILFFSSNGIQIYCICFLHFTHSRFLPGIWSSSWKVLLLRITLPPQETILAVTMRPRQLFTQIAWKSLGVSTSHSCLPATGRRNPSFSGHLQRTGFALVIPQIIVNWSSIASMYLWIICSQHIRSSLMVSFSLSNWIITEHWTVTNATQERCVNLPLGLFSQT